MSDFLSNLVARSLGVAEVVRPRLASLFEPPQPTVVANTARVDGSASVEEVVLDAHAPIVPEISPLLESLSASHSRHRARDSKTPHDVSPVTSALPERPLETTLLPPPRPTASRLAEPAANARLPKLDAPSERVHSLPPAPASSSLETRAAARAPDLSPVPVEQVDAGRPEQVHLFSPVPPPLMAREFEATPLRRWHLNTQAMRLPLAREGVGAREISSNTIRSEANYRSVSEHLGSSRELGPSDVRRGEPVALPTQRPSVPATTVVHPRVEPYAEPASLPRSRRAVTPEPTIQVTIGRVEVRAMQPVGPSAPRERQAPAAMSLEEYLRRRAKGSGR